jgi:hypothetical protein
VLGYGAAATVAGVAVGAGSSVLARQRLGRDAAADAAAPASPANTEPPPKG